MRDLPSGTVTLLFTEIIGSTEFWEQHSDTLSAAIARFVAILQDAVEARQGTLFKTLGDGACAVFASASEALTAAITAQRAFLVEPWETNSPLRVRLALHTGVAEPSANDYFGPLVSRTARLMGAAHGGQLLVSLVTAELVRDDLPPEITLHSLGSFRLRDLSRPEQILQVVAPDLPADFPPLNTLDHHMHNLPAQTSALIDRELEVTNIGNLLRRDDVRLLTLSGPGGTGKTRLALHAAAEMLDHFSDGIYFVPLASINDSSQVPSAIAQAIGVRAIGSHSIVDTLKGYLAGQSILLLLDNFEQVLDAALLVSELLAVTPRLKLMITSRSILRLSGEREFGVPPLTLPDRDHLLLADRLNHYPATRLFVERAQAIRPGLTITETNAPVVAEICYRLDGLPLAIELAAARCKLFSPTALLERLNKPLSVLTSGPRDMPQRQQTLRATIEWSYDLLAASEQILFTCIAVFVGGCTVDAIEAICDEDLIPTDPKAGRVSSSRRLPQTVNILDGISLLLDQSLLQQVDSIDGEPRLIMLETIRQYAFELLAASDYASSVQARHASYYLSLAEKANSMLRGPEQGIWLVRLEAEHDNLCAALEWLKSANPKLGLHLACALWPFWEMHSYLSEGRVWLNEMLRLNEDAPTPWHARALNGAGVLAHFQGDYAQALIFLQGSLTLFQEMNDNAGVAFVLRCLGLVAWFQGDHDTARRQLEASVAQFRLVRYSWGIADSLHWLGHVDLDLGDAASAHTLFEESLVLFRKTGDKRNIALPLKDFGLIASQEGNHAMARSLYEESLSLSRAVDDSWHIAETLQRLGDLARLQGDAEQAATLCKEGIDLWRKMDNKGGIAETLNLLGEVAQLRGNYQEAERLYTESLRLLRVLGSKRIIAGVLYNLGRVAHYNTNQVRATDLYLESLALHAEIFYMPGIADCLVGLAAVAAALGAPNRAAQLLGAAEPHLNTIRGYMPLSNRAHFDSTMAGVRAQLAQGHFAAAFALGRAMPLDQAVANAQGSLRPSDLRVLPSQIAPAAQPSNPAGLTERELEVLRFVAQGLTDAQVAEQLTISRRTVNGHLRSIYNKLDVSSRTAAVHYAVTNGLV